MDRLLRLTMMIMAAVCCENLLGSLDAHGITNNPQSNYASTASQPITRREQIEEPIVTARVRQSGRQHVVVGTVKQVAWDVDISNIINIMRKQK